MKNSGNKSGFLKIFLISVLVILLLFAVYKGGRWLENRSSKPDPRGDMNQRLQYDTLVEFDGQRYRLRKDLSIALIMGIDTESEEIEEGGIRSGGQADFQRLIVFDRTNKEIRQIQIDRDTMTDITIIDVFGEPSGVRTSQLCLAYSFGEGGEQSCQLNCDAVSNLFYNIPIDFYCAVNMDGIAEINDFLGGITVTLEDDFTALDPAMEKGKTMILDGQQAELYVRSRMSVGVGTNEARMERQRDYISKLLSKADELQRSNADFAGEFYEALQPFMTTNVSKGRLINEVSASQSYSRPEPISIPGRHEVAADGHMQFFADEESLKSLVLDNFFEKIN